MPHKYLLGDAVIQACCISEHKAYYLPMATAAQVDSLVQGVHATLWPTLHGTSASYSPAKLEIRHNNDGDSGYSKTRHVIILNIPPGNLDMPDVLMPAAWPVWKIDLVEEMLHEYQNNAIQTPSVAGKTLYAAYWQKFYGPGHDELFFTAIEKNASHFKMTPEKLVAVLCGKRP